MDPAPSGHVLQLVGERLQQDDERKAAELPHIDPAPLNPLPSTVRVFGVLDPATVADVNVRRLHVGSFGKDHA